MLADRNLAGSRGPRVTQRIPKKSGVNTGAWRADSAFVFIEPTKKNAAFASGLPISQSQPTAQARGLQKQKEEDKDPMVTVNR
jgi:hypothetical protein